MSFTVIAQSEFDADDLSAFVSFVTPPALTGERRFYSDLLGASHADAAPVLHVNSVAQATLPVVVDKVEHHPHAAQVFIPLDVSRYIVTVMGSDADGAPDLSTLRSVIVPGTTGVVFKPGVWHVGASVLDRPGHFTVLMWRGTATDDVFRDVTPFTITASQAVQHGSRG